MKPHFCAIANRQAGEDLIGTAGHYQTYVLIECPLPWAAKVFDSENIPPALRQYVKAIKSARSVQFLAVNRGASESSTSIAMMVYEKTVPSGECFYLGESASDSIEGYRGYEFQLDDLTQVVDCLEAHWQGDRLGQPITQQDILICTHGMRDKCCARFGQPFYRETARSAKRGELPNIRLWQVSHIGGHRFAPTAISLPDGRYYGRLTLAALRSLVTREGSINQLRSVYRGWGLLPAPLQVLERQLMLQKGWSWFDYQVAYRMTTAAEQREDELWVEVAVIPKRILIERNAASRQTITYRAKLTKDSEGAVCAKVSCSSAIATPFGRCIIEI